MYYDLILNLWMKKMNNLTINQKRKTAITIATILLTFFLSIGLVTAQTQITDYDLPTAQNGDLTVPTEPSTPGMQTPIPDYDMPNEQNGDINIPTDPSNPGEPQTEPTITPTPTPEPQTDHSTKSDYTTIAITVVIVAIIIAVAAGFIAWTVNRKSRTTLPPQP